MRAFLHPFSEKHKIAHVSISECWGHYLLHRRLQMRSARQTGDVAVKVPNVSQCWLSVTASTTARTTTTRIQNAAVRRLSCGMHTV